MEKTLNQEKQWVTQFLHILEKEAKPSDWIEQERLNGRLSQFFPELLSCFGVIQNQYHKYDVYYHLLYTCDAAPPNLIIRLAALFHDIGKPQTRKQQENTTVFYNHELVSTEIAYRVLKRWEIERKMIRKITLLVRYHMFHYLDHWSDSAVRRLLRKVGEENLEDLFLLRIADRNGNGLRSGEPLKVKDFRERIAALIAEEKKFKIKDLALSGKDLLSLGIPEGKKIGEILKHLFCLVESKKIENNKEILLEEAKKFL